MIGSVCGNDVWRRLGGALAAVTLGACNGPLPLMTTDGGTEGGTKRAPVYYDARAGVPFEAGVVAFDAGDAASACAALSSCCIGLSTAFDTMACEQALAQRNGSACVQALGAFHTVGLCGATGPKVPLTGCAALGACCVLLPESQAAGCGNVVGTMVDATCMTALTDYQKLGACTGKDAGTPASGCSALSACCGFLASNLEVSCNAVVAGGVAATCTEQLTSYENHGECE
jgi:hypothetical protein